MTEKIVKVLFSIGTEAHGNIYLWGDVDIKRSSI